MFSKVFNLLKYFYFILANFSYMLLNVKKKIFEKF